MMMMVNFNWVLGLLAGKRVASKLNSLNSSYREKMILKLLFNIRSLLDLPRI